MKHCSVPPSTMPPPAPSLHVQTAVGDPQPNGSKPRAPRTRTEEGIEESRKTRAEMEADVADVLSQVEQKCNELGEKYHKKALYFINWVFNGGGKMVSQRKTNSWNAWNSEQLIERRERGTHKHATPICCTHCLLPPR